LAGNIMEGDSEDGSELSYMDTPGIPRQDSHDSLAMDHDSGSEGIAAPGVGAGTGTGMGTGARAGIGLLRFPGILRADRADREGDGLLTARSSARGDASSRVGITGITGNAGNVNAAEISARVEGAGGAGVAALGLGLDMTAPLDPPRAAHSPTLRR